MKSFNSSKIQRANTKPKIRSISGTYNKEASAKKITLRQHAQKDSLCQPTLNFFEEFHPISTKNINSTSNSNKRSGKTIIHRSFPVDLDVSPSSTIIDRGLSKKSISLKRNMGINGLSTFVRTALVDIDSSKRFKNKTKSEFISLNIISPQSTKFTETPLKSRIDLRILSNSQKSNKRPTKKPDLIGKIKGCFDKFLEMHKEILKTYNRC